MGLHTNVNKKVGVMCQPCGIFVGHSEVAYMWKMMGVGPYFWEMQMDRVQCPECKMDLVVGLLAAHHQA